ncbi:MAG TPA: MarR family transcriptional regulator [Ferruginibacter sp.]|nr:MarR family transcriptional regulator [Bacteroidota bacterium]MCC6693175.1 MarR family transcriptional regulator [Chitinophagaceae bacterium]HMT95477.1 MarR family transcriptional regulator [Ferruginibacter sp.]HMU24932.1 MarR family transcriptional regulator [Ferruginibacter sp.]HRD43907.1 MarR family transcriptional regulator [Ferruginibacter sp.]
MDCAELPQTLGFMLVHTGKQLLKTINGKFNEITGDITFEQLGLLYYISRHRNRENGLIQQNIAEVMEKTKSAILRSIDILEEKGLVKRLPAPGDRRKNIIELTNSGSLIAEKVHSFFLNYDNSLKKDIAQKDIETCMSVLCKIQEKCKY